jgi:hypothetical protein
MVSKEFSQLVNGVVNPDPGLFGQVKYANFCHSIRNKCFKNLQQFQYLILKFINFFVGLKSRIWIRI